jgi:hypothetical protein
MPRWGALCRSALSKLMELELLVGVCRLGQREVLVRWLGAWTRERCCMYR